MKSAALMSASYSALSSSLSKPSFTRSASILTLSCTEGATLRSTNRQVDGPQGMRIEFPTGDAFEPPQLARYKRAARARPAQQTAGPMQFGQEAHSQAAIMSAMSVWRGVSAVGSCNAFRVADHRGGGRFWSTLHVDCGLSPAAPDRLFRLSGPWDNENRCRLLLRTIGCNAAGDRRQRHKPCRGVVHPPGSSFVSIGELV